jgi:RHS repeat-associated protein
MKRLGLFSLIFLLCSLGVIGQTPSQNYVMKHKFREGFSTVANPLALHDSMHYTTIEYVDGLGRPIQQIKVRATPNATRRDLITPMQYDLFGRSAREYLPYYTDSAVQTGLFRSLAVSNQNSRSTAIYSDVYAYSENQFEASSASRLVKKASPGTPWRMGSTKEQDFSWRTNTSVDAIRLFTLDANGFPISSSVYGINLLWVEIADDEDDKRVIQYTNTQGELILKKVQNTAAPDGAGHTGWLSTYYVYDDLGQLRVVIPPMAVDSLVSASWSSTTSTSAAFANESYYRYSYDNRGRMIEKRVPGKGLESMVYDNQDRLVGFQDANMAAGTPKKWLYTKYDALGRVVMTGLVNSDLTRASIQATLDATAVNNATVNANSGNLRTGATITSAKYDGYREYVATTGITLQPGFTMKATGNQSFTARIGTATSGVAGAWPTDEGEILTVNYYDSYQFLTGFSYVAPTAPYSGFTPTASTLVRNRQTGKKVKNLDTGEFYTTAIYYDDKGRVIQTLAQQQLGGTVRTSTAYSFENQPIQTLSVNSSSPSQAVLRTYTYNVAGLLQKITHRIGSQTPRTIVENTYNDLGQLTTKAFPQLPNGTQTYTYNIRGWLTKLGSGLTEGYKQTNHYETGGTVNNWNGNISRIDWSGKSVTIETPIVRTYNYTYDKVNRITAANYTAPGEVNWYTVSGMSYDSNGNLKAMTRRNQRAAGTYDVVDQLTYTYQKNSNKLTQVTDGLSAQSYTAKDFKERSAALYTYDPNGNLKSNLDKQIDTLFYNHLNLPSKVSFNTGATITFTYNAEGEKLSQKVFNTSNVLTTTQDYIGEFVYQNGALDYLIHEEGRFASEPGGLFYEYYLKDHLGNVRQVLRNSSANFRIATMEQANAAEEESTFTQIKPTRKREPKHNVTQGGQEVAWLNASMGEMVGPGTTQEIFEGDSVTLSVHGKFLDKKKARVNEASFATMGGKTALLDQLNELALNSKMAGGPNPIAVLNLVDIVAKDLQKKETPEAYLIYALYDEDSNRYEVGKKILTRNAANQHEELEEKIAIKKNGYIETFVVNETSQDVWFDNFKILSQGSILVQETHYDPWGLELTGIGYEYAGVKKNKYLYNGIEYMDDSNLNIYSAEFRNYDPAIGRWLQIDPYDKEDMSPYSWVTNNPIIYADPLGLDSVRYNNLNKVVNPNRDIVLPEVTISASYTGPKASDSPNVKFALSYYFNSERPLATGAVEPIFLTPNPIEALVGVTDNLSRGEIIMAGIAGFALLPGGKTVRGVVKAIGLPVSGKIRFIPRIGWTPTQPLTKGPKGGYLDRFGNEWIKKKVSGKGPGEIHWDVQLSPTGKFQLGHLSNSGNHLNVTVTGQIAH